MEEIVSPFNAWKALLAVERNGGAPGIDGMTTKQLREHLKRHGGDPPREALGRDVCA